MTTLSSREKAIFRNLEPLVLASSSPRRRELLGSMGLSFEVVPSGTEEAGGEGEAPETLVVRWAEEKARVVSKMYPDRWILAADTIVVLEGVLFGKPRDAAEAVSMLRRLSNRTHEVISGVCLLHSYRQIVYVRSVRTFVHFKELSAAEISAYVDTGEPMDKAGAYGIQGRGAFLVHSIQGSYTNVVGLPLCETLEYLMQHRVIAPAVVK
ncbi:Maf family protein [Desulforhabdus amnigena]|nr:Maf family protein [Desulforhabdus amnigena]NLJ27836.1 septum formation inhibitor Maf [Deltaproteobacteria bacterium]